MVRDQAGAIHAFYNVCRHRGTRLCEDARDIARRFNARITPGLMAWTGASSGAPHMDEASPVSTRRLFIARRKALDLWEGFIFVSLAEKPMPLENVFAPLAGKFAHWNLPLLRSAKRIEYDVRANWKLIFENYSECYHCPGVHPALAKVSPYDSAENDLAEGPFLGGFMEIAKDASLTMSGKACARPVGDIRSDDHAPRFLLLDLSQPAPQHASRIMSWCINSGRSRRNGRGFSATGSFIRTRPGSATPAYSIRMTRLSFGT